MADTEQQPGQSYAHLETLLEENLETAKENQKILKRMERNALIGFVAKIVLWLIVLGVPIIFLSSYLGPLLSGMQKGETPSSVFGVPSADQLQQVIDMYRGTDSGTGR